MATNDTAKRVAHAAGHAAGQYAQYKLNEQRLKREYQRKLADRQREQRLRHQASEELTRKQKTPNHLLGLMGDCLLIAVGSVVITTSVALEKVRSAEADICRPVLENTPGWSHWVLNFTPLDFCAGYELSSSSSRGNGGGDRVQAFLDALAWAEGSDYSTIFTHATFSNFTDHPRQLECSSDLCSDAAGRYQFLSTTWDEYAGKLGLPDFSPESQDQAAIALLDDLGALDKLNDGDIEGAFCLAGSRWASLPCSASGQPQKTTAELLARYQSSLGSGGGDRVFPLADRTLDKDTTSEYGPRTFAGQPDFHNGHDLACSTGEPLLATEAGTIQYLDGDPDGYGDRAVILNTDTGYEIVYGHADERLVPDGARVDGGDAIATCGWRGRVSPPGPGGAHLHFEIRRPPELPVDPLEYLKGLE